MSISPRPETSTLIQSPAETLSKRAAFWRVTRLTSVALLLVFGGLATEAQVAKPQRAIERLEGCSKEERKQGCISILSRRPADSGKQAIKAQVRGGRIIWYEYDTKTGKVRRTN